MGIINTLITSSRMQLGPCKNRVMLDSTVAYAYIHVNQLIAS